MNLTINQTLLCVFLIGILMFSLRLLPFIIFYKKEPSSFFKFSGKYIPAISIAVLFIACLREKTTDLIFFADKNHDAFSAGSVAAGLLGITGCIILHLWKKNSMISIFGGTIIYMILNYLLK